MECRYDSPGNLSASKFQEARNTYGKKFVTDPDATIPNISTVRTYVFMSKKASFNPCLNDWSRLSTQSSCPISSSSRQTARDLSSSDSHFVVRGKLGNMKYDANAMTTVMDPSMMNSHRHARNPRAPSRWALIPAAMRPEKAPLIKEPE